MVLATLLAVAQEAEEAPPLIDVDGTLFIQFALFLLMLAILSRVLFRPYLKLRDERDKGIAGARHEAGEMEKRADQIVADYDAKLTRAKQRGADERAKVRADAAAHERQVLGAARDESARVINDARAKLQAQAASARRDLDAQAQALAKQMARKVLGREVA